MVNQELLNDTLQKINASLNKRFEKDADLYISRQDESDMKKHLCNGAYGAVADMAKAKGISHDVTVKVLVRNASVINVTDFRRFEQELQPILQDANYSVLEYMMEDVFANNVYMQRKIRHILFYYFMSGISTKQRLQYWDNTRFSFDAYERARLYGLILEKAENAGPLQSLDSKIDFMNRAFTRFPSIMKDRDAMLKLTKSLEGGEKTQFFKYLSSEVKQPSIHGDVYAFALVNAYCSYGEMAFQEAVGQIRSSSPSQYESYIKVIRRLFEKEQDPDVLVRMFDDLYKAFSAPYMKNHIRKKISRKVWPILKEKPELYEQRKAQLDKLLSEIEAAEQKRYTAFSDIAKDISAAVSAQTIAFGWVNIPGETFGTSLEESFTSLNHVDSRTVKEIYRWLFQHSMRKGGTRELAQLCERMADPLYRFAKKEQASAVFELLDGFWVDWVMKYKLKGKTIEKYMFEVHFDLAKEWQQ